MRKKETYLAFGLLLTGILLPTVSKLLTGERYAIVDVISIVLIVASVLYQFYVLYKQKQYKTLKDRVIRLGVVLGVLMLLLLIWGN